MARSLVMVSRIGIMARRVGMGRMAFITMERMMVATIGMMDEGRVMILGYFPSIAIVIMKAIVVVMTVQACPIDYLESFYPRSDRLCDCCPWQCLLRIELISRSASTPSRLGRRHVRFQLAIQVRRCATLRILG